MRALTFDSPQKVKIQEVAEPKIQHRRDAIIRVTHTAICGSDLHVYHGRESGLDPGTIMGHEFVGEIIELGPEVSTLKTGDTVFSPFTSCCGTCRPCTTGLPCRCAMGQLFGWVEGGTGLQGGQCEYVRVPFADSTLKTTGPLLPEVALLLGDVLSTGGYCAEQAHVAPGGTYAVIGGGPVGLMALTTCQWRGARDVVLFDPIAERREQAKRWGGIPADPSEVDRYEGAFDAVLEAVGSPAASLLAYKLVRPGGIISIVGVHNEPHFAFTPNQAYDKNLTVHIGRCPARRLMDELMPQAIAHSERLTEIFTHRVPLSDGPDAYRMFAERKDGCLKVLLSP